MSTFKSTSSIAPDANTDDLHSVASTMEMAKLTKHTDIRSKARILLPNSGHSETASTATLNVAEDLLERSVTPTPSVVADLGPIPESRHEAKTELAAVEPNADVAVRESTPPTHSHDESAKFEAEEAGFVYVEEEDEQRVNPLFASFNGSEAARRGSTGTDRDVDSDEEGHHTAAPLTSTRQFSNPESQPPKPAEPAKRPFFGLLRFRKPKLPNANEN